MGTSLLDLPRELRDEIIRPVVLYQPAQPPNARRHRRKDVNDYPLLADFRDSVYQPKQSPSQPLLHVNKQLRAEALDAIAHYNLVSTLHVAFVDWCWMWPTWRIILPRTKAVLDRLDVDILLAATKGDYEERRALEARCWRTSTEFWAFISRLLAVGPVGPMHTGKPDQNVKVRELRINLSRPFHEQSEAFNAGIPEQNIPVRSMADMAHLDLEKLFSIGEYHAEEWLKYLREHLDEQLRQSSRWTAPYKQLVERLGKVVFTENGNLGSVPDLVLDDFISAAQQSVIPP